MGEFIQAGEGDFFVQENREDVFAHLTCVGVGDLPLPKGDLTPQYCPDPAQKGKYKVEGFTQAEPGAPSTTLTRPLSSVANWLLEQSELGCEFNGWVTYGCAGQRANPENYDLAVLLYGMRVSDSRILSSAVSMQPADENRVMTDAEISYQSRMMIYLIGFDRQGVNNTANANAVAFLPMRCEDRCGPARGLCTEGYMALGGALYDSEIKYTTNGGATWTAVETGPFALGGSASDLVIMETSTGHRAIFSRGSSTAGAVAEISLYEDFVKLRDVNVGAIAGQTIQALDLEGGRIWAAASGGYIYMSETLGDSWVAQESANETTEDVNDIAMYTTDQGYAVCDNNVVLMVTDGSDWNAITGPAAATDLLSVAVNDRGHVFVGAADGVLYVSRDEGTTWAVAADFGTGSINHVSFPEKTMQYVGFLIYNDAAGVGWVYKTKDGGASWQLVGGQSAAWNGGLNGGFMCDQNNLVVVGDAFEGTTFVAVTSVTGS